MTDLEQPEAPQRRTPNLDRRLVLVALAAILGLQVWLNQGTLAAVGTHVAFARQVWSHFDGWDLNRDGSLSAKEVAAAVPDVRYRGEAAAALAAIHTVQRAPVPGWHDASFGIIDLIAARPGDVVRGRMPPFAVVYAGKLDHIRTAGRALFADGAPAIEGVRQGQSGDCFLIAHAGAVIARDPYEIRAMMSAESDGGFTVRFPGGPAVRVASLSDAEVALGSTAGAQGIWINVLEKAFGQIVVSRTQSDALAMDSLTRTGSPQQAIALLTGHEGYWFPFRDLGTPMGIDPARFRGLYPEVWKRLHETDAPRWVTSCETTNTPAPPGMIPSHVYAITGFDAEVGVVHLWNPLGIDFTPKGPEGRQAGYHVRSGRFSVPLPEFLEIFVAMTYESGLRGRG